MESLNYAFEEKGFHCSDELPVDSLSRTRSLLNEFSLNPFSDHHEGEEFIESGLAEMLQRSKTDNDLRQTALCTGDANPVFIDSKSCSDMAPKKRMNPKKMVMNDSKEGKRARVTNFSAKQVLICQVDGCDRDLSSSKDYHKRHKVCDEHSKTAKVIVNGIEQRFCQQCSRFHLLAEFDEDKRSCRKRLAGHNERRRKPLRESHWDIAGPRLLNLTAEKTVSFLFPEVLSTNHFFEEKYDPEERVIDLPQPKPAQELCRGENFIASHSLLSANNENVLSYPLSELDNFGVAERESVLKVSDGNIGLNFEAEMDRNLHISDSWNLNMHMSSESGETIDLLQLSTHLLRVEQQRSYPQVKQDSCNFCFTTS
ncbi:unnamed protein product [Cuscuta epithymum]|uniref:SBP-type domain-containing protein n=3 Tax=Cuscuta epithymum TaxID=186058 RepID=A0AAV0F6V4_9ASTE|nr:unnamed protein product [Cuscuta epithymum]